MLTRLYIILMALLLPIVPIAQAQTNSALAGSEWRLISYEYGTPVPEKVNVSIIFGTDDSIGGSGGCNAYGGNYTVTENRIAFQDIFSTMMACAEDVMLVEQTYFNALQTATNYRLSNQQLVIVYHGGELIFTPAPSLNGTKWDLAMLNDTPVLSNSQISILFDDGRVSGFGGCNSYGGDYAIANSNIQFNNVFHTERACLDNALMEQEQAYLTTLNSAQSYEISNDMLYIYTVEGQLVFVKSVSLFDFQWHLVSYGDAIPTLAEAPIHLSFGQNGQLNGFSGCNQYSANYETTDTTLKVGVVASTKKACLGQEIMNQEQSYLQALQTATDYRLSGNQLIIIYDGGELVFIGSADLVGTQWELVNLKIDDDATTDPITLRFDENGRVSGFSGCNSYSGNYEINGDSILFNGIISTLMACADEVMALEQTYFIALQSVSRYVLEDDQLILIYNSGRLTFALSASER